MLEERAGVGTGAASLVLNVGHLWMLCRMWPHRLAGRHKILLLMSVNMLLLLLGLRCLLLRDMLM